MADESNENKKEVKDDEQEILRRVFNCVKIVRSLLEFGFLQLYGHHKFFVKRQRKAQRRQSLSTLWTIARRCIETLIMLWRSCLLSWVLGVNLMISKGWLLGGDLHRGTLNRYYEDISLTTSCAFLARVQRQFFQRRIVSSF
ncbi:unnamed protein product [Arabidopsis thaliana]|uniref:(thale cress) hypothetical protein n=1 Tax=Arabidopsis thaliana TaxID=3702 RepID=A0A7G2EGS0_ARATH|nr:unnamed protein product [Arabidopsis thaliana]